MLKVRNTFFIFILLSLSTTLTACHSDKRLLPNFALGATSDFYFESNGTMLSGVFDTPREPDAEALVIFIHGYGPTDIRARNSYKDLRTRFNALGVATATWDKPGQGKSEGVFDINQSVYSSADEVVDAANYLRKIKAPGSKKIVLWGISRAGWIAPLAMMKDDELRFWISISGTTAEDNFSYLLLSNLAYEGGTLEQAALFEKEWRKGCEVLRTGGSFDSYLKATQNLRANDYITRSRGGWPSRLDYEASQTNCKRDSCRNMDDHHCSYIFVENFESILSSLDAHVLAIFGEKDLNIDWRKTLALYESTLGNTASGSLEIARFADADHNLNVSRTGSIKEMKEMSSPQKSDGYYKKQIDWLKEKVLINSNQEL
jgi:hypothetical protein